MDKLKGRFIKYWIPVIVYAIFIFCVSSVPGDNIPRLFSAQSLVFHIAEYAIFAFLISRALRAYYPDWIYRRRFLWVFFLAFIYAVSDEFHQSFVPNRCMSLCDLAWDSLGVFVTYIFYGIGRYKTLSQDQLKIAQREL